ncbi:MAG: dTDP-4-dehydrorhamnose 3,5-epimerase family protein [Pseudomonadota bacterium]
MNEADAQSAIPGVLVKSLKLLPNERGRLMEVLRCDEPEFKGFGQAYITESLPTVVKAWYRHQHQTDHITCITGLLKLVLYDDRSSSSEIRTEEVYLGELSPKLVVVPPGVWHGYQSVGPDSAFILHLNTEPYNFESPDEERLDMNTTDIPYTWS